MLMYWLRAAVRAWRDTSHTLLHQGLLGFVIEIIAVAVAYVILRRVGREELGWHHLQWHMALFSAIAILFLLVFLLNLIAAPARMETEERKAVEAQEKEAALQRRVIEAERDQLAAMRADKIASAESSRRQAVYQNICRAWVIGRDLVSPDEASGLVPPPVDFVNHKLEQLGESFRLAPDRTFAEA